MERAVLTAVCGKLRSFVGEEDFAAAVDRSLREASAARRAARADVARKIAVTREQLRRALVKELESTYPSDLLSEERSRLTGSSQTFRPVRRASPNCPRWTKPVRGFEHFPPRWITLSSGCHSGP
ncbi:hypothetical protein ACFQWF_05410 [Methylorubrum suomiense]